MVFTALCASNSILAYAKMRCRRIIKGTKAFSNARGRQFRDFVLYFRRRRLGFVCVKNWALFTTIASLSRKGAYRVCVYFGLYRESASVRLSWIGTSSITLKIIPEEYTSWRKNCQHDMHTKFYKIDKKLLENQHQRLASKFVKKYHKFLTITVHVRNKVST